MVICRKLAVVQQVGAGVADVADEQGSAARERRRGERGAHALVVVVGQRLREDGLVGVLDRLAQRWPLLTAARSASSAVALATSPARWPPMPSATATRPIASSTR